MRGKTAGEIRNSTGNSLQASPPPSIIQHPNMPAPTTIWHHHKERDREKVEKRLKGPGMLSTLNEGVADMLNSCITALKAVRATEVC